MPDGCKGAGLASYSPHDLRHRFISVKIREGRDYPNGVIRRKPFALERPAGDQRDERRQQRRNCSAATAAATPIITPSVNVTTPSISFARKLTSSTYTPG